MCGRYQFSSSVPDPTIAAIVALLEKHWPGQYRTGEIFPGDPAPAVVAHDGKLRAVPAVFGFPGFQDGKLILNARAETAADKPMFARALRESRIVLPAAGFYEWEHTSLHTKHFFQAQDEAAVYLCGLSEIFAGVLRFVVLTRSANASMAGIHTRMPLIIPKSMVRAYLTDPDAAMQILKLGDYPLLHHPVQEIGKR